MINIYNLHFGQFCKIELLFRSDNDPDNTGIVDKILYRQ